MTKLLWPFSRNVHERAHSEIVDIEHTLYDEVRELHKVQQRVDYLNERLQYLREHFARPSAA